MGEQARYLYAIVGSHVGDRVAGTGLAGRPLEVVGERDLAAVVSDVDLDEFGEEGLRANLERLDWLEEVARGHDAVVHQVAGLGGTAPMRLATICLDDQGVRRRVAERYDDLLEVLARVQGCDEWSIKLVTSAASPAQPEPAAAAGTVGGAEYLRRKKVQTQARASRESDALAMADQVHDALSGLVRASRRLPAQDPRLTGHEGTMVLNAAYLVAQGDQARFLEAVDRVTGRLEGVRTDCAGPWPPYSFAMLDSP